MLNGKSILITGGTRYGNVMASRGSVIPLFVEQIKNSQPLTITDPNMTRFMMTLLQLIYCHFQPSAYTWGDTKN
ncbi:hypothetical protein ES708_25988 [subsurface metagenome]